MKFGEMNRPSVKEIDFNRIYILSMYAAITHIEIHRLTSALDQLF